MFRPVKWLSEVLCPGFRRQADLLTAASEEDQRNFSTAFAFPVEKIKITGYPRNDVFFNRPPVQRGEQGVKKGIYVPTFRGMENSSFDFFEQFGFDVKVMDQRLSELNVQLFLKLHHFNFPSQSIQRLIRHAKNIFFYDELDVYGELGDFDFLMTDFSSIYFDFLLAAKPIIFTPFDRGGFEGGVRQLYYDYDEVTPGPKANNWHEVLACIGDIVVNPETYLEQLKKTEARFHQFSDGNSSQRVYDEVTSLLQ